MAEIRRNGRQKINNEEKEGGTSEREREGDDKGIGTDSNSKEQEEGRR